MTSPLRRALLMLCLLLPALTACTEKPQHSLRIGAVLWPGYEPLYLAGKLGYYEAHPVKIVDYLSNTDAMLAFKNHHLDAGAFTLDETLQLIAQGMEVDIILIMDISHGGDVILANEGIDSVRDLRGKPVAVESSAVGAYVLKRALELHDMSVSDIQIVSINAMEQASRFASGQIEAAVSFDPARTQLVKAGKQEIFSSTQLPNEIFDVLVVRKTYAEQYPATIQQLVDAWFSTLDYQNSHPVESAAYSLKRFNTTTDEYLASLKRLRFASKEENRHLLDVTRSPLLKQQHMIIQILQELGLISETPSLQGHLNQDYIR